MDKATSKPKGIKGFLQKCFSSYLGYLDMYVGEKAYMYMGQGYGYASYIPASFFEKNSGKLKNFNSKETNMPNTDYDVAVLVSGGLDSYIAYLLAEEEFERAVPVFVNLNQPYVEKELKACKKLFGDKLVIVNAELCEEKLNNVPTLIKNEIYGRNVLLALYGAILARNVWLASIPTENILRDNSPEFFHMCSALFTYLLKNKRPETVVETPFSNHTKSSIVKLALDMGCPKEQLLLTTSCYAGDTHNCGQCAPCLKRWVAMTNNHIEEEYESTPYLGDYAKGMIPKMLAVYEEQKETEELTFAKVEEVLSALKIAGVDTKIYKK